MEVDRKIIKEKILDQNLRRFLIMPLIAIPINLVHVFFFYISLPERGTFEYDWRIALIVAHFTMIVIGLLMLALYFSRTRFSKPGNEFSWLLIHAVVILLILTGVFITISDQLVTPAITPLLLAFIAIAVIFLIHPLNTFIIFLFSFGLFYFFLPLTQTDPEVLLSNRVNALTAAGLGYLISVIIWKANWANIKQNLIIEKQKSELEQSNLELRTQAEQLRELNATKDRLFSIIAHDLRNPFSSIIGFSDMLKDELPNLTKKEIEKYTTFISNSAGQTLQLLDNLLEWARMQQGKLELKPEKIDLQEIASEVIKLVEDDAMQKNITLQNLVPGNFVVTADKVVIKTILRNLINNAIKFTCKGGNIEVTARMSADEFQVSVADTGIGISREDAAKLFNAETNFTIPGTADEKGTGIGLIICKDLVSLCEGNIWVESVVGKGSVFSFSIPMNNNTPTNSINHGNSSKHKGA